MKKPADIKEMEEKIKAFQKKRKAKQSAHETAPSNIGSAAKGFQLSIELISGVFIGACIGYFLDIVFKTAPVFLAVLTIFGGAAGVLNVYKSAKGEEEE